MNFIKTFERIITVSQDDLDENNHVNNIRYIKWIEDIAKEHWQQIASEEIYKAYYWIVSKHIIDYKASAHFDDQVKITTKFVNSTGATAKSLIEMHNSNTEKLLLIAETVWCLMGTSTNRPTRVTKEIDKILI